MATCMNVREYVAHTKTSGNGEYVCVCVLLAS